MSDFRTSSPLRLADAERLNPYQLLLDLHDHALGRSVPDQEEVLAELALAAAVAAWWSGYWVGAGGEHRSAPIPLNLITAMWLPVRDGMAWLSEACTPCQCAVFLHVQVGDLELPMSADYVSPVLTVLSDLLASAATAEKAIR